MIWFFRKPKPIALTIVDRPRAKVRMVEFKADPALVAATKNAMANEYIVLALDVVQNEHPANWTFAPDADLQVRAAHQAKIEGYNMALANLRALTEHQPLVNPLEPTFEKED